MKGSAMKIFVFLLLFAVSTFAQNLTPATAPTDNDCVKWIVSGGLYTLGDAGAACGSGGSLPSGTGAVAVHSSTGVLATPHDVALPMNCKAASASGTAYTCSTSPTFTPASGDSVWFNADVASTASATLAVNGATAATIQRSGANIGANTLLAGSWTQMTYDGTYWQMLGPTGALQGNGIKTQLSTGTTTTNDCVKFDANGNTVDAGAACGSGSGGTSYYNTTITPITTGSWTTLGSGCTVNTLTNAFEVISSTGGSGNICGVQISVAAGNFTHYFALWGNNSFNNYSTVGVGFTDGTKTESVELIYISPNSQIASSKSSALTSGTYASANGDAGLAAYYPPQGVVLIELARSGTALAGYVSLNGGYTWSLIFNDNSSPYLTASALTVFTDPRGSSGTSRFTLLSYQ